MLKRREVGGEVCAVSQRRLRRLRVLGEGRVNGSRDSRLRASVGPVARFSRLRVCAVGFQ